MVTNSGVDAKCEREGFSPVNYGVTKRFPINFARYVDFRELQIHFGNYSNSNDLAFFALHFLANNDLTSNFFLNALTNAFCFFYGRLIGTNVRLIDFSPFLVSLALRPSLFLLRVNRGHAFFLLLHFRFNLLTFALFRRALFDNFRLFPFRLFLPCLFLFLRSFLALRPLVDDVFAGVTRATMDLPRVLNERGGRRFFFGQLILVRMLSEDLVLFLLVLRVLLRAIRLALRKDRFAFCHFRIVVSDGSVAFPLLSLTNRCHRAVRLAARVFLYVLRS